MKRAAWAAVDLAALLTAGCVWTMLALLVSAAALAFYLGPFVALWYLLP